MKGFNVLKTMSFLLASVLMLGFTSCGDDDDDDKKPEEPNLSIGLSGGGAAPATYEVSADGGSQKFAVTSNGKWKITQPEGSADWLTVSPKEGNLNGEFTISVAKNTSTDGRDATLAFEVDGKANVKTYKVAQLAFGPALSVSPEEPEAIAEAGGDVTFTITTNADEWEYAIADEPEWITEKTKNATTLTLTVAKNADFESRLANITFKLTNYPEKTQAVELTQSGNTTKSITLAEPAADAKIDLSTVENVTFSWTGLNVTGGYKLLVSASADMATPLSFENITATTYSKTAAELDAMLKGLGVALGAEATAYWTVVPQNEGETLAEAAGVRAVKITRIKVTSVVADLLDVVFNLDGTATDASAKANEIKNFNEVNPYTVAYNETYKRNVVTFNPPTNGSNLKLAEASYFRIDYWSDEDFKSKLADGHSFECLIKFDVDYSATDKTYETKFFSTQEGGGTGFLITNKDRGNEITFLPNVSDNGTSSNWQWGGRSGVKPDGKSWYHVVGVWDKANKKVRTYINGQLAGSGDTPALYKAPNAAGQWLAIGGDAGGDLQNPYKGSMGLARVYDAPLTDVQVEFLWNQISNPK